MVSAAAAAIGLSGAMKMKAHTKSLSALINSLSIMQGEICVRLTPLPEIIEMLAENAQAEAQPFFALCSEKMKQLGKRSFSSIWKEAVNESYAGELKSAELEVLEELGGVLGRYNVKEQQSSIEYAVKRLDGYLRKAEQDAAAQGKTKTALGVALGLMLVIMLI